MARRKTNKSNATQRKRSATIDVSAAKTRAVEALARGASMSDAASAAGISRTTLWQWRQDDDEFRRECEQARAGCAMEYLEVIRQAATRGGDWRAASWWLEKYHLAGKILDAAAAERELAAKQTERPSDEKRTGEERRRRLSDLLKGRPS